MRDLLARIPFHIALIVALTPRFVPFVPEPYVWEKLRMLGEDSLRWPIDIFDPLLHALPWMLLLAKVAPGQFSTHTSD